MQTITSGKVQSSFGAVADVAKGGEPVIITQHGRPTLMLLSFKDGEELLRLRNKTRIGDYYNERRVHVPDVAKALSIDEITDLVHELRP